MSGALWRTGDICDLPDTHRWLFYAEHTQQESDYAANVSNYCCFMLLIGSNDPMIYCPPPKLKDVFGCVCVRVSTNHLKQGKTDVY